mmetsp:Transcript_9032/g.26588  ORF Transcript_9032/g.26588 Transcript_9032/m.26588 type:complete len:270 (+) Transcript_9032:853-1662(+)
MLHLRHGLHGRDPEGDVPGHPEVCLVPHEDLVQPPREGRRPDAPGGEGLERGDGLRHAERREVLCPPPLLLHAPDQPLRLGAVHVREDTVREALRRLVQAQGVHLQHELGRAGRVQVHGLGQQVLEVAGRAQRQQLVVDRQAAEQPPNAGHGRGEKVLARAAEAHKALPGPHQVRRGHLRRQQRRAANGTVQELPGSKAVAPAFVHIRRQVRDAHRIHVLAAKLKEVSEKHVGVAGGSQNPRNGCCVPGSRPSAKFRDDGWNHVADRQP